MQQDGERVSRVVGSSSAVAEKEFAGDAGIKSPVALSDQVAETTWPGAGQRPAALVVREEQWT